MHGVNLGGWLVLEKWMTPSLFKGTSAKNEYELSKLKKGRERIKKHHETFITEADIAWLSAQRVQLLRVPVGYWTFGDAKPYVETIAQLDWLVEMAGKYNLKVLIDLHAAPEAQNSQAHSGSGNQKKGKAWLKNKQAKQQTIDCLVRIAEHFKESPEVWGIELLNEPRRDFSALRLIHFYRAAYKALVKVARPGTYIVFSDAFSPHLLTNTFAFMKHKDFPVVLDTHLYYCFGKRSKRRAIGKQLRLVGYSNWLLRFLELMQPVMVGEWSAMLPYTAKPETSKKFAMAQREAYEPAIATCYWSYKTEKPGRWNYRWMVENGLMDELQKDEPKAS
ncbi:MAG TPA: cellulase family glycosylhydrolase [Candidatus Saccharibacteria bacterium]|nr:cellulase family glycosylhydrolase [Candidatus Saccharibacteria bacterium]